MTIFARRFNHTDCIASKGFHYVELSLVTIIIHIIIINNRILWMFRGMILWESFQMTPLI